MSIECKQYQPILPPEIALFIGEDASRWEWFPYPSRYYWKPHTHSAPGMDVEIVRSMDAIGQSGLEGTLEGIDISVGCQYPCQTCIRDSQSLSSVMSLDMFRTIVTHPAFTDVLPEHSVCLGFAAEPSDNPHVVDILHMLMDATADRPHFRIDLKMNYRRQKEETLRTILHEAGHTNRFRLTISLPLNRDDRVQEDFRKFREENGALFTDRILIFDVKHPQWQEVENRGRVLPDAQPAILSEVESFQCRGRGGLYGNPEGLWLAVNVTKFEAHTPEIFTRVTAENAHQIGQYLKRVNRLTPVDFGDAKRQKCTTEKCQKPFQPRMG